MPDRGSIVIVPETHQTEGILAERLRVSTGETASVLRGRAAINSFPPRGAALEVIHLREIRSDPRTAGTC
jgi:hypothetical protein